jgi:hypothetical protein
VIGTFIVFFYLYVYGYKNEGFINFDGNQTIWDKKNDLENKLNDIKVSNQAPLNPPPKNTNFFNILYRNDNYGNGSNNIFTRLGTRV